ncbi:MAG: DUF1501 domain-containing protein, partial [Acidobacteriaceae bacterium]|nr:DUF1501 domain-containing protein [Acidobacteriaceae bacterium]
GDMETHAPLCRAVDKPVAGLVQDLKQRGLLDETLVDDLHRPRSRRTPQDRSRRLPRWHPLATDQRRRPHRRPGPLELPGCLRP